MPIPINQRKTLAIYLRNGSTVTTPGEMMEVRKRRLKRLLRNNLKGWKW